MYNIYSVQDKGLLQMVQSWQITLFIVMTVQGQAAPVVSSPVCLAGFYFKWQTLPTLWQDWIEAVDLTSDWSHALKFLLQFHANQCLIHPLQVFFSDRLCHHFFFYFTVLSLDTRTLLPFLIGWTWWANCKFWFCLFYKVLWQRSKLQRVSP